MKNDQLTSSIINFLLPIIFLFGCFFFVNFLEEFSALICALVLVFSGFLLFYIAKVDFKMLLLISFENVAIFLIAIAIAYIFFLLLFVTDFFSI